jgi:hypothetical protein
MSERDDSAAKPNVSDEARPGEAWIASASRTWRQQHARMMRAYQRATAAADATPQGEDNYYVFFIWCFQLKDWLKNDPAVPAATRTAAEHLVNTNDALKLCADLANGIKHLRADRRARVDADSQLDTEAAAFQPDVFESDAFQTEERIVVVAARGYMDARQLADACVAAWAEFLRSHGLNVDS